MLADARDNAGFAEADEWAGVAEPDGVGPCAIDLWQPSFADFPTDRKLQLAIDLERAVLASDPRITGVRTSAYGDSASEAAVATSTGIAEWSRATTCSLSILALAADGASTQTGSGLSVGARSRPSSTSPRRLRRRGRCRSCSVPQIEVAGAAISSSCVDRARPGGRHPDRRTRREGPIPVRRTSASRSPRRC